MVRRRGLLLLFLARRILERYEMMETEGRYRAVGMVGSD